VNDDYGVNMLGNKILDVDILPIGYVPMAEFRHRPENGSIQKFILEQEKTMLPVKWRNSAILT
jgi:hypothetical protein